MERYWHQRHAFLTQSREKLAELDEKATTEELSLSEWKEKAYYIYEIEGLAPTRSIWEEIHSRFPEDPSTNFTLGMLALDDDREEGVEMLETAMAGKVPLVRDCCTRLERYLSERGRARQAVRYKQ